MHRKVHLLSAENATGWQVGVACCPATFRLAGLHDTDNRLTPAVRGELTYDPNRLDVALPHQPGVSTGDLHAQLAGRGPTPLHVLPRLPALSFVGRHRGRFACMDEIRASSA